MKTIALFLFFTIAAINIFAEETTNRDNYAHKSYGIFVHYGWGGNDDDTLGCTITEYEDGHLPDSLNETANNFDVEGFVDNVAAMSPEYLIFTAWHCGQNPLYPSAKMTEWRGAEHSSERDVLQELLDACDEKGIDVYFYIQPSEAHDFSAEDQAAVGYVDRKSPELVYNNFINEMIAELADRYKTQLKGFWLDKGLNYGCTDTERIGETIRGIMPDAVIIANEYANETADYGAVEVMSVTANLLGEGYADADDEDEETWPAFERSVSFVSDRAWSSQDGSIRYTSEMMYKYTVLEAGVNEEGGGVAWALGPFPTTTISWNNGILSGMTGLGELIDEVGESIKSTTPSDSWPTAEGTRIQELDWGIATRSYNGNYEYLHVLKAPDGTTLTIDVPADGREYISATNLRTGNACTISQTTSELSITLHANDSWHAVDAVIKLATEIDSTDNDDDDDDSDQDIDSTTVENIALNGTASQSTTAYDGDASLAIDGNTNGIYSDASVTHTEVEDAAWWQVDLGADYPIGEINIFGRSDAAYADRLSDYTLYVISSDGSTTYSENFTTYPTASTDAGGVDGQIIKIVLNVNNPLSLAEVEVFLSTDIPDIEVPDVDTTVIDTSVIDTSVVDTSDTDSVSTSIGSSEIMVNSKKKLKVYPNPVVNTFVIEVAEEAENYIVVNRSGQTVLRGKITGRTTDVDVSKLHFGLYQVQVGELKQRIYKADVTDNDCGCP